VVKQAAKQAADLRELIDAHLRAFGQGDLTECSLALFQSLGYQTDKRVGFAAEGAAEFLAEMNGEGKLNPEKALTEQWRSFSLLFQLTKDEIVGSNQIRLDFGDNNRVDRHDYQSYLFFGLQLQGQRYTRSQLAEMTRQVNKLFVMPVMLLFRYGECLTLAVIDRRPNQRDESLDVLRKVTLIQDISVQQPHRAHIEILQDLSIDALYRSHKFTSFLELHQAWQKTLDSSELNRRFFKELADWYFWATEVVRFPAGALKDGEGKDSPSVIRMITRLIFVWFLKEKRLVPDELFRLRDVEELIDGGTDESSYYKAVLQNLFFATLNQEMNTAQKPDNRKFRGKSAGGRDQHYGIANVYRYEALFGDRTQALALFDTVPFLNGGLFECLDNTEVKPPLRVDGFSDRPDNPLYVPNALFFSDEQAIDLNSVYRTKNKKYKVRGLINILDRYKFTITENTPIEEEIALDPELLGKVFENLLASYNEETKETARKQTGSFYTPREVVDYMVNESLKVYLGNALAADLANELLEGEEAETESLLTQLLDYNEPGHGFDDRQVDRLIEAIDGLKMLDPAVGSGAFPMGILQKLVFILSKLDPHNFRWRDAQIAAAERIDDSEVREKTIENIHETFDRNELDYGRKLFLIQNCIYGVDIQAIAVQIAKLRFFISLIVDQRLHEGDENRGIRPLPNLETKFVAANTLIGLEGQLGLKTPEIEQKERQLAEERKRHFGARSRQTKERCRERDRTLRQEIGELLQGLGFPGEMATKMAAWNPYDLNQSSPFFDAGWMFGQEDGFDVVIGNPPYVRQEVIKPLKEALKPLYQCYTGTADLYVYFYERGLQLLRSHGVLTFISSNKYFRSNYGKPLREYLSRQSKIHQIIDFGDAPVFTAIAYPTIVITEKAKPEQQQVLTLNWQMGEPIEQFASVVQHQSFRMAQQSLKAEGWQFANDQSLELLERLRRTGTKLGDYIGNRFYRGVVTGLNEAFVVDRETRDRLIAADASSEEVLKPFLRGRDVKRWTVDYADLWLIFTRRGIDIEKYPAIHQHLLPLKDRLTPGILGGRKDGSYKWFEIQDNIAYWQEFERSKIIIPAIVHNPDYAIDFSGYYGNDKTNICVTDEMYFISALLNSKTLWWFIQQTAASRQGGFYELKPMYVTQIPIAPAPTPTKTTIETLVQYILHLKATSAAPLMLDYFEQLLNAIVYELYFPAELHDMPIASLLQAETLPRSDASVDELRSIYATLSHADHPLRQNCDRLAALEIVRLIEGKG
jgi:adenine-specific DNA-methyltransferase